MKCIGTYYEQKQFNFNKLKVNKKNKITIKILNKNKMLK